MDEHLLTDCARNMWAFPLVGAFLGLLAGLFGWAAIHFLPGIVVGAMVLALLLWMTGLHHTDGLLDFGDGVMAHGTPEHKIDVMHDQLTGAGALALGIMTILIAALSFGQLGLGNIVWAVIVVELCAKLSMVVVARVGRPVRQGMNSAFLAKMHGMDGNLRLTVALVISFTLGLVFLKFAGIIVVLASVLTALAMVAVAHKHFKGVTGDIFGATNELSRMVCAIVVVAVVLW